MRCIASYSLTLPANPEVISINAGLQPATSYRWEITTKFNNVYAGDTVTDANGVLEIPNTLPAGLFMPFSGAFLLRVYTESGEVKTAVNFTVDGQTYDTIELLFSNYKTVTT